MSTGTRFGLMIVFMAVGLHWSGTSVEAFQPLGKESSAAAPVLEATGRSPALRAILDEHVAWLMEQYPEWASQRGDDRWNDRLTDWSPKAVEARNDAQADRLARLKALPRDRFTEDDRLDADLLTYQLERSVAGAALHREQMPITAMDGPHISLAQLCDQVPFLTDKHYLDYAARLEAMPTQIRQQIAQMELGLRAGRTPPRIVFAKTLEVIADQMKPEFVDDPTKSPFYRPFLRRAGDDPATARARKAISDGIVPAFRELHAFMGTYISRCRESVGLSQGVDGEEAYEFQLAEHTTTSLSAKEIHELGLLEVARIQAEMVKLIRTETRFITDDPSRAALDDRALLAAFIKDLRGDARFVHTDKDAMLRGYRDIAKRIDAELPHLFGRLPRNTYGVREIPGFAAASSPAAYYYAGSIQGGVPGYFMVNTLNLSQRPKYTMISLALHEAVPGHHFQGSIAEELRFEDPNFHEFRSLSGFTAYVEGWALYAEKLGLEMGESPIPPGTDLLATHVGVGTAAGRGFYTDPYDYFGSLSDEIWRACRLVVDTGLHSMGWTRQQAIDYLLANSAISEYDAASETDRYIGWPGQACAYKIGQLKIIELRRRAQQALGSGFDERSFHDCLLGAGALPLPVLESRVGRWTQEQRSRGANPSQGRNR